ncbi:MAG: filamentous hemagglutinin N-terminal domain-containing protein [Leptolyngbyaceae cyanobacterium bins.302]|nr:filamentous hemagglutinin N-terminal domain-containing protein [Leptolyngbyaceae cyanobacterium bins.302]
MQRRCSGAIGSAMIGTIAYVLLPTTILPLFSAPAWAQISAATDGTNTTVNQAGNSFNITGGTQAGSNLFHSFQQFGLNQGQIANFLSNPAIANILGRVTGGDASIINGLIQVTGSNANLYLMNPAGIVFGANASLNVPASFTATTANGIGIGNGWFNAVGNNNYAALVSTPNQFVFTTPNPGAIVNAGNLAVGQGQNITLLGGTVISTGTVTATGGTVTIATVPGEKLVRVSQAGSVLSLDLPIETRAAVNPANATPVSLPVLLTGGNGGSATGLTVENGITRLTGSGVSVTVGDVVAQTIAAQTATLSAANNVTLPESQIQTTGNLQVVANNVVTVRDSVTNPVTLQAGKDMTIQGDRGIDILALNHPNPAFQSGGTLSLVSDGIISGDAHYASGNFSLRKRDGTPGKFISLYDPIISANGDVVFGDYTGVSLKVEATGNIATGNIQITGNDPAFVAAPVGSDRRVLGDYQAVILRAGVPALQETGFAANPSPNPPFAVNAAGTVFSGIAASGSVGRVTVGTPGNPSVPSIAAEYVDISAPSGIVVNGPIVTDPGSTVPNGYVRLAATNGDVIVHSISSGQSSIPDGPAGIDITAGGLFKATGTLDSLGSAYLGYTTRMDNYLQTDPTLLPFLQNQTGDTATNITNAIEASDPFSVEVTVNVPVSLSTYLGPITIRYAGGGAATTLANQVVLQGGDAPFTLGPNVAPGAGAAFVPVNPADNFSTFVASPFALVKNESYAPVVVPTNESGTVGAIIRTIATDGSLTLSLQNRVIGTRPIVQPPTPTETSIQPTQSQSQTATSSPNVGDPQTVQRTFISQNQNSACTPVATTTGGTDVASRSQPAVSNPCTSTTDEQQILKILGEDRQPQR